MIDIINYGIGNLKSLSNAFSEVSESVKICNSPGEVRSNSRVVLPGVGAFKPAMNNLIAGKWDEAVIGYRSERRPLLGICLGLQLLYEKSFEHGEHTGLGYFKGNVLAFNSLDITLSVPNIGWRRIAIKSESELLNGISDSDAFYFLHSYYCEYDASSTLASSNHGDEFSAINLNGSFLGVQFHPEKSSNSGKKLIENFARWNPIND